MALLAMLVLPVAGGLPQLLTREVAIFTHASEWSLYRGVVRAAHIWVLLVALFVIAAYIITGPIVGLLPNDGKWALLGIVILLVPLQGLNAIRKGALKGLGFPAFAEMPTIIIQPVLLLVALATLATRDVLTAHSALWAQVCIAAVTFILASILFFAIFQKGAKCYNKPAYKSKAWLLALLPLALISLVGTFNAQIGILLLGLLGKDEAIAALRVGESGAKFVSLSLGLANMVISPYIVKIYRDGNSEKLQELSRHSARGIFLIALTIGLIRIIFGKPLLQLAFGSVYVDTAYIPMVILVFGHLFNVALGSVGILLIMSGHERITLWGQFAGLSATIILMAILVPLYEAVGAAISITSAVIWNSVLGYAVFKYLRIRPGIL